MPLEAIWYNILLTGQSLGMHFTGGRNVAVKEDYQRTFCSRVRTQIALAFIHS